MSTLQIVFLVVFLFAVATVIFFLVSSETRYAITLKRNCLMAKVVSKYTYKHIEKYAMDLSWWNDKKLEKCEIKSHDNLNLVGYFLKKDIKKIALIVHGYGAKGFEMQRYAKMFYDNNYSIFIVDNRGHGESDGKIITMGYEDCKDVASWVKYITDRFPKSQIVVFGLSMGASTVCLYSRFKKPKNVKAIISDCAYSNAFDVFNNISVKSVIFSILPTMLVFNWYLKKRIGFKLSDVDICKAVKNCDVPILFIHGNKDKFVPFYMQDLIFNSAPKKLKQKLVIENAGHAQSIAKEPKLYEKTVFEFLNNAIN